MDQQQGTEYDFRGQSPDLSTPSLDSRSTISPISQWQSEAGDIPMARHQLHTSASVPRLYSEGLPKASTPSLSQSIFAPKQVSSPDFLAGQTFPTEYFSSPHGFGIAGNSNQNSKPWVTPQIGASSSTAALGIGNFDLNSWNPQLSQYLSHAASASRTGKAVTSDAEGADALQKAAYHGHETVVGLLLKAGANPQTRNRSGENAVHLAAKRGHQGVLKLLLEKAEIININACDHSGQTALHVAAAAGHLSVVQLLLEKGIDINIRSGAGLTALHSAAERGHQAVVKLVLERGADVNAKSNEG